MDELKHYIELCARGVEILGIITIIAGTLMALIKFIFAIIVIIRTFLSLSIQVEIESRFPWQRLQEEEKAG